MSTTESNEPLRVDPSLYRDVRAFFHQPNGTNAVPLGVVARANWSNDMSQFSSKPRAAADAFVNPRHVDAKHLADMLARVHDPVVARIFLSQLDTHPELQLEFLGASLKAQETIKRDQIRYAKARDAGLAFARHGARLFSVARWVVSLVRDLAREVQRATAPSVPPTAKPARSDMGNVIILPDARKTANGGQ